MESKANLSNLQSPSRKNNVPLKGELIEELKEVKEKYLALEEKSKDDIKRLETENLMLKETKKNLYDEVGSLKQKVQNLEEEKMTHKKSAINFKCYECNFEASEKSVLQCHLYDKHAWKNSEDLDLSVGPRYCNKCEYKAEDGYDLDGHYWSEHDKDECFPCKFCDEEFPFLNELMMHKKLKHIEKVSFCSNFATSSCIYGDLKCWFVHEPEDTQTEVFKCKSCEREFCSAPEFLRHRKIEHLQSVPICKKYKSEECTFGNKKCWFRHETDENNEVKDEINDKKFENNETVQKMFKMMENMTKRITDIEKRSMKS